MARVGTLGALAALLLATCLVLGSVASVASERRERRERRGLEEGDVLTRLSDLLARDDERAAFARKKRRRDIDESR